MVERHAGFAELMDHLAGRESPRLATHLGKCAECAGRARQAARLLAAGRRAMSAPAMSRKAQSRAMRIFRQSNQRSAGASTLRLVLDSLLRPAPAVRASQAPAKRFLRYEGKVGVDLQITREAGRIELRGQMTPAGYAQRVDASVRSKTFQAAVEADGTFVLRGLPPGPAELRLGDARILGLELE
jgi:hypothetical protein